MEGPRAILWAARLTKAQAEDTRRKRMGTVLGTFREADGPGWCLCRAKLRLRRIRHGGNTTASATP